MSGARKYDDPKVRERLLHALRSGADVTLACGYAGITRNAYYTWRRAAQQKPESKDGKFMRMVDGALSEAAVSCLLLIKGAAETGSWQAAAWYLERAYPHIYGRGVDRAAAMQAAAEQEAAAQGEADSDLSTDAQLLEEIRAVNRA